jgi:hypothetical protein
MLNKNPHDWRLVYCLLVNDFIITQSGYFDKNVIPCSKIQSALPKNNAKKRLVKITTVVSWIFWLNVGQVTFFISAKTLLINFMPTLLYIVLHGFAMNGMFFAILAILFDF